ncbi:hypothetical protein EMCRGX_G026421 [Ephydatia muelleri]
MEHLVAGKAFLWKSSKGTPYDVKLLRVHDNNPTNSGKVQEARVRLPLTNLTRLRSSLESEDESTVRKKAMQFHYQH